MKKISSIVLSLILVVLMLPMGLFSLTVSAETSGVTGDCVWELDGTVLTIYGNGEMGDYSLDDEPKAPWGTDITKVVIEEGVTRIGSNSFARCSSLCDVTIPNTVKNINNGAFCGCTALLKIDIPEGVVEIGSFAFDGCTSLYKVTIPDSVKYVGEYALNFTPWYNGRSNGVVYVGNIAYEYKGITECPVIMKLVDGTIGIAPQTFFALDFEQIVIPESIEYIGEFAFEFCYSLTDVWYTGDEQSGGNIDIERGNEYLTDATWHYNICKSTEHIYDDCQDTTCNNCEWTRKANHHQYDNDCDTECNLCKKIRTIEHKWDDGKITEKPTCVKEGVKTYTCSICKTTKPEAVAKTTTHTFGEWKVTLKPTTAKEGTEQRTCKNCNHNETRAVEKLPAVSPDVSSTVPNQPTSSETEKTSSVTDTSSSVDTSSIPEDTSSTENVSSEQQDDSSTLDVSSKQEDVYVPEDDNENNNQTTLIILIAGIAVIILAAVLTVVLVLKKK